MKQDIAKQWVAALRSGKYSQHRGALHDENENSFCCLGVLCDISGFDSWHGDESRQRYLGKRFDLPDKVKDWAGLKSDIGYWEIRSSAGLESKALSQLNDNGVRFSEIADVIEKDWADL